MDTFFVTRPDGRLACSEAGAGPLVVLAPGMGDLREVYRDVVGPLVAAGLRVVTTDLRGHGGSSTGFTAHGVDAVAGDLEAVLEHLGEPAALVGHSVSAGAAAVVAARRPDLVTSLVMLSPHLLAHGGALGRALAVVQTQAIRGRLGAAMWVAYYRSLYRGRRPDWFEEHLGAIRTAMRDRAHVRQLGALARALVGAAPHVPLAAVTVPVLVVHGADDPEFPDPAADLAHAEAALTAAPTVTGLLVPESGHYPHAQRPDVVVPALLAHLAPPRA